MKLSRVLHRAREALGLKEIEDSGLEAELLMRQALGISRVELYQDLNRELSPGEEADFGRLIGRRLSGEPVAYITGHREFFGLDFYVDPRVLIPRPETELLVEKALELARERDVATIADIGTGSGAIAVSLALNLPRAKVLATDVSPLALEVARFNCQKHGVSDRVTLLAGDLLSPLTEPVDLIVANLPYVGVEEVSRRGLASFEPELALAGGYDGLDKIRELSRNLSDGLYPGGSLLLEVGIGQSRTVAGLLQSLFPAAGVKVVPDLSGIDRVVILTLSLTSACRDARISR
jgi:release factor glutamine methyltransferase